MGSLIGSPGKQQGFVGRRLEMLNLNPSLFAEDGSDINTASPAVHYTDDDLTVKVLGLPWQGAVVGEDGATIYVGDTLRVAELAGLSYTRTMDTSGTVRAPVERR